MDVVLICFSQTGNTRKVATAMVGALQDAGHSAREISLKGATPEDATGGDLLGVGTPCLSSQAPTPIKDFLRALPPLDGQPAFVFATSSGAPGRVLYDLTHLLRTKRAHVLGGFLARGQVYHPAPCLTGQFPGRPNAEDLIQARRFAIDMAEHLSAGRSGPLPEGRPDALAPQRGLYDLMGLMSSDIMLRLLLPEPKPEPGICDQCQWCVLACPMENITLRQPSGELRMAAGDRALQPYPVLGDRCIRCYRCLTGCPQKAFGADWRVADPFLRFLYNAASMRWFGDLQPGEQIY